MAKNITLLGASYSNVPAVELPQTGGGTAKFTDTSPTTATDSDVASGKIYFKADGTQSTGTGSGGGGGGGIEITQDANGYIVLPSTGGGGGGGGSSTFGSLTIQNNTTVTVNVFKCGTDNNGNVVQNCGTTSIASGQSGTVPVTWHDNSTTGINTVLRVTCNYASTIQNLTATGTSTSLTYKIGYKGTTAYIACMEQSGTTITLATA